MTESAAGSSKPRGCLKKFTSCRWILAFMLCMLRMCQTALRQSIGMALVCMAERPPVQTLPKISEDPETNGTVLLHRRGVYSIGIGNDNATEQFPPLIFNGTKVSHSGNEFTNPYANDTAPLCDTNEREFLWDAAFEGVVLSSYYYGYLMTPLLSSYLERVFGAKRLVATCIGVGAVVNLLTPELTRIHRYLLVALRIIAGTTNGMIDPAVQALWASWAPRSEVAYLTAVEYAGVSMGGIFTFLISGLLCQIPVDNGWPLVFYFYGTMSTLWVALWVTLVFNKPSDHPRIAPDELKYILSETQSQAVKCKIHPPWLKMLLSPAVWAIIVASATFMWVYSWVLCYLPMYMQDVLHYNISQNAMFSSLPFVGKFVTGLLCGYIADRLLKTRMSVAFNRKMFQMIGCFGCAACTIGLGFLDHDSRKLAVALLILALSLQNITTVAYRINPLDIAPRHAGFILGLANTIAVAVSMTAPLVTSAVVYDKSREQWQILFCAVAGLSILGGITFLFLGKATIQDWARMKDEDSDGTTDIDENSENTDKSGEVYIYPDKQHKKYIYHPRQESEPPKETSSAKFLPRGTVDDNFIETDREAPTRERGRRQSHGCVAQTVQDLDAASQWSSCLTLSG